MTEVQISKDQITTLNTTITEVKAKAQTFYNSLSTTQKAEISSEIKTALNLT